MGMDLQSEMIPNVDGLAYVGGEWDASKYAPFDVDKDKIILICKAERKADHLAGTGYVNQNLQGKDSLPCRPDDLDCSGRWREKELCNFPRCFG